DLTLDILRSTEALFGEEGLEKLIRHREAETLLNYQAEMAPAQSLQDRVAALTAIRTREGYMADWEPHPDGGFLFVENHCPICAAAALCQGLCRSELKIFQAVLGAGAHVERTDHILAGARRCAYRISERSAA
ncbi:MAG: MarR family transcriptional regulator, partial [Pseudomonadota bacterium]